MWRRRARSDSAVHVGMVLFRPLCLSVSVAPRCESELAYRSFPSCKKKFEGVKVGSWRKTRRCALFW